MYLQLNIKSNWLFFEDFIIESRIMSTFSHYSAVAKSWGKVCFKRINFITRFQLKILQRILLKLLTGSSTLQKGSAVLSLKENETNDRQTYYS